MVKQTLAAAGLAVLVLGAAAPAHAEFTPFNFNITDPYGRVTSARTFLSSPDDTRPDAGLLLNRDRSARESFVITPFGGTLDGNSRYGVGIAYANSTSAKHPYELDLSWSHFRFDGGPNFDSFVLQGKYEVYNPKSRSLPVISIFGGVEPQGGKFSPGTSWGAGVLADQAITKRLYLTGQVGWTQFQPGGNAYGKDVIQSGVGASYQFGRHLSLSGDYMLKNSLDGEDRWTATVNYAPSKHLVLKAGGGKHDYYFGSLSWKTNWNHK